MEKKTKPHQEKASGSPASTVKAQGGDKQLSRPPSSPAPKGKAPHVQGQRGDKRNAKLPGSPAPTGIVTSLQVQGGNKHDSKPPSSPAPKGKSPHMQSQGGDKQNAKPPGSPAPTGNVTSLQVQRGNKQNSRPPSSPAPKGKATHVQSQGGDKENAKPPGSPAPTGNVTSLQVQGGNKDNSKPSGSPTQKGKAPHVQSQGGDKQNANLPGSPASTEKVILLDGQGWDKQYASASGSPGSKKVATVDGQGGDEQRAKLPEELSSSKKIADVESRGVDKEHSRSEAAQSIEDLDISGTSVKNPLEDEVRRLKAENHFLKTILDHLHTNLYVGDALQQQELKPPEDIQNDQSILEFSSNAQKVVRRFQELEIELDIIYKRMSQFSFTNAGGKKGKGETPSKDRSDKTATNEHIPEKSPASTPVPSDHSLEFASPVSKEKNRKESNIENVSSPMEERSGVAPNLEGADENTGHKNITEASDKTSPRQDVDENKMYPTERKHSVLERVVEVEQMISKQNDVIKKLKSDLKEAKTKLQDSQKLEEQVESLRMRLSELAGAKYTKDNANVTDLSDLNRPTKLAEQYSELYSNEWSDAFEQQSGHKSKPSEVKIIKTLLDILLDGFRYCKSIRDVQHLGLREIVLFPARDKAKNQVYEENSEMNEVIARHLTEAIKLSGEMTGEHVAKVFFKRKDTKDMLKKGSEGHSVYVQKCVKLCWLMQIQTPPVCIDFTAQSGDQFDKDTYKEYTKKGSKIDFIVWPPLRLHEGGPLLAKGVAQGK